MPWQQNVFRKTFLVVHVLFEWRFPGVRSVISAAYLRLPTQISLLLSTGLAVRIFGLGFSLLLPLPLLPLLVRAIDVRQWSDGKTSQLTLGNGRMAKQAKRSIVGMSIAIWWC